MVVIVKDSKMLGMIQNQMRKAKIKAKPISKECTMIFVVSPLIFAISSIKVHDFKAMNRMESTYRNWLVFNIR